MEFGKRGCEQVEEEIRLDSDIGFRVPSKFAPKLSESRDSIQLPPVICTHIHPNIVHPIAPTNSSISSFSACFEFSSCSNSASVVWRPESVLDLRIAYSSCRLFDIKVRIVS